MALPTPHYYQIKQAPNLVARVKVNDVPWYRRLVDFHHAPAGPANHLFLPGENEVTIEIHSTEQDPYMIRTFELLFMKESDDSRIFRAKFPDYMEEYPEEERKLPFTHKQRFLFEETSPLPVWFHAPREGFSSEGSSEQHEAVRELHAAYANQDIDAFLHAMEHKTAEFAKFYGHLPELSPENARASYGKTLREPWDLRPYDPTELVFERHCDGRVAYVTRRDGGPALSADHKVDPSQTWQANLLLTRIDGRWRIFW